MTRNPDPIDIHVGERLRLARLLKDRMSQEKLGEALGVSYQQVQKVETGVNRLSASKLARAAACLGLKVEFFFEDAPIHQVEDESASQEGRELMSFLASSDGLLLNRAFAKIGDAKLRKRLVDLIREVAKEGEEMVAA